MERKRAMNDIAKGTIGGNVYHASILTADHLPAIMVLQEEVIGALTDRDSLQPLSEEEIIHIFNGNGLMIGIFIADELIAFRAVLLPEVDEEHLGLDCGIPQEQLSRVLYQEISNVSPRYRGLGLQKKMASIIMDQIDLSLYDYVCATVKPLNIPSLKDKFSQGFHVAGLKEKYGGKLRYIFLKNLKENVPSFTQEQETAMTDTLGQQRLIKAGFIGTHMLQRDGQWIVVYRK